MLDFDHRMPRHPEALAVACALEDTVAVQEQQFGPDDPRTIGSRLRLVEAYETLDLAGDDRDLDALETVELTRAVDSRIRTLGPDHPDTLTIRYDLTLLLFRQAVQHGLPGQDELVDEFRSIADVSARTLGHAHPMTVQAWERVSGLCPEPERAALRPRIVRGWEEMLADQEQRLGPDDPQTLETMGRLAGLYRADRGDEAQRLVERVAAGWGRVAAARSRDLGPVHADTATARDTHLRYVNDWVSPGTGKQLFEELVADHVRLLGPDHPRTLHAQRVLLRSWQNLPATAPPETVAFAGRLLDRMLAVLGPDHDDFLMLRYHLLSQHLIQGDQNAADDLQKRCPLPPD